MFSNLINVYNILSDAGVSDPLREALHLLDVLSQGKMRELNVYLDKNNLNIKNLVQERKKGTPLEYILGEAVFMGRTFICTPDTLIPREETELLAKVSLNYIHQMQKDNPVVKVMDIGTGCGNLAISLALGSHDTTVLASDISKEAVNIASKNVEKHAVKDKVKLYCGDLFEPFQDAGLQGKIDLVVCNPPYIPTSSLSKMAAEIIDHEPKVALDAGSFGINIFKRLISDSITYLKPGGVLVFEIGGGQDKLVTRLFRNKPDYVNIDYFDDGREIRVISAKKSDKLI